MQIDITKILQAEPGFRETFVVDGERPQLEGVALLEPIEGSLVIMRTDNGVGLLGKLSTAVELDCHRCLRPFQRKLDFKLSAEFSQQPEDDQFLIADDNTIDIAEAVRQDLLVSLPLQQLCQEDCKGIELTKEHIKETYGRT